MKGIIVFTASLAYISPCTLSLSIQKMNEKTEVEEGSPNRDSQQTGERTTQLSLSLSFSHTSAHTEFVILLGVNET